MKKMIFLCSFFVINLYFGEVGAHCQMPCGIYNDQMVYDKIDEYYKTMVKAVSALNDNKFTNLHDRNQFIRWVTQKDKQSDEMADVICTYFLMQKIPPDDEDSFDLVKSAHKLLFLIVAIKQNVDLKIVNEFGKEWDHFKQLFHPEIECKRVMEPEKPPKGAPVKEEKGGPISLSEDIERKRAKLHRDHQHDYYHSLHDDDQLHRNDDKLRKHQDQLHKHEERFHKHSHDNNQDHDHDHPH